LAIAEREKDQAMRNSNAVMMATALAEIETVTRNERAERWRAHENIVTKGSPLTSAWFCDAKLRLT
jgi:hypothetical protein